MNKLFSVVTIIGLLAMIFLVAGCAGIQLKGDVKELLIEEIAWESGYFTAKGNPKVAKDLEKRAAALLKAGATEGDFNKWIACGIDQLVEDPVLANRFKKLSQFFEIDIAGIESLPKKSERIGELLTEFSAGVDAGLQ